MITGLNTDIHNKDLSPSPLYIPKDPGSNELQVFIEYER